MKKYYRLILSGITLILMISLGFTLAIISDLTGIDLSIIISQKQNLIFAAIAWFIIELIKRLKKRVLGWYDITEEDNLKSRKLHTQIKLIEKILIFIIILSTVGLILLSFDSIRKIGIGIFASAGLAGIIIGLSAQKVVGALLAGIQIAVAQPFRIDDAVVVEGEWGWIEEINLTFVVVRLWDKRRLVLPTTYFLEKPFQNWTRNSADIVGTVFLQTDYRVSFEAMRVELTRLLEGSELWDGKVNVLQVTDSKATTVETRILVSAKNSPTAWDLRVYIREKMLDFIRETYPESLPRTRIVINQNNSAEEQH